MKTPGKVILVTAAVVALGAGGYGYWVWRAAQRDTARITSTKEVKQTAESVETTLEKGADFSETSKAIGASGMLSESRQLELLAKQLENPNAATRLAASTELMKLHAEKRNPKAGELLAAAAAKESDVDVRNGIEAHFARQELAAASGPRLDELKKLLADRRVGYRVVAAGELGKLGTPEAKALLEGMKKDPADEVQIAVEEALAGGGQDAQP